MSTVHHLDTGFHPDQLHSEGEEAVMRDPESLTDWLGAKCMHVAQVAPFPVMRDVTAEDLAAWSMGWLVALMFDPGQPSSTTVAARDAIRVQYLADPSTQAAVQQRQLEIEERRAEDERHDAEEAKHV